jgi:diguanylate cyclase (GGDEF)-like protein
MDVYLLITDPNLVGSCTCALEPFGARVQAIASPDAIRAMPCGANATVLLTTADFALKHCDEIRAAMRLQGLRTALLCSDASAAASVEQAFGQHCEIITGPIESSLRFRAADWHRLEALQAQTQIQSRQIQQIARALETSSQDMTSLRQKVAFLDRQGDRLGGVLETMNILGKLAQEINCLDLDEIITVCVTKIPLLVNARYASLYMHNYQNSTLELKRHNHGYRIDDLIRLNETGGSPMARALLERRILLIRDFDEYERLHHVSVERPNARKYSSKSCIIVPMLAGDRVVAVLNLADKRSGEFFDEVNDLPPLEQVSVLVGSAIRNWQLFQEVRMQAKTDAMTHFINHQTFFEELEKEVLRVRRYHGALSVLMVDVDNFKLLNDVYGHQLGDQILTEISRIIRLNVRDTDIPARYGGDEFAIMLAQADAARARLVAERIREMVDAQTFTYDDKKINLSLSIGVAQYRPGQSVTEFIAQADKALYEAKARGRNCVATGGK